MRLTAVIALACLVLATSAYAQSPYWVDEMKAVHANFTGTGGAIARFGDSITYSGAFFKPMQWAFTGGTPDDHQALNWLQNYIYKPAWGWQDDAVAASDGCYSGTTTAWPLTVGDQFAGKTNIAGWLGKLKPEMAVVMWGTNDLGGMDVTTYTNNMRTIIQTIKDNGTIPLVTTIPPKVGADAKALQFAQAVRDLTLSMKVPLIDYSQAIYDRRPGITWQNTLISGDGVHPSWDGATAQNFDASSLASNGYLLRNYVTLHGLYDVFNDVMGTEPPAKHMAIISPDIQTSDLAGLSGAIRRFPVPSAAQWPTGAKCVYDNYAAGLQFSPDNTLAHYNLVSVPLSNADVTIHGVTNDTNAPVNNDSLKLYTNPQGSSSDPRADIRYPYSIPRLARSAAENFLAVRFDLAQPSMFFGVFLPSSSNTWGPGPDPANGQYDDQNFVQQTRGVWVIVTTTGGPENGVPQFIQLDGYSPFLSIKWDGTHMISSVAIIHDNRENAVQGVGFMDAYTFSAHAGDANSDGSVDVVDLGILARNYDAATGATWDMGDYNHDGKVDVIDLGTLAREYDWSSGSAVPEPASLSLLALGGLAMLRRRK